MPTQKDSLHQSLLAADDVGLLVAAMPGGIQAALHALPLEQLIEVVMDLGRTPEARFPGKVMKLSDQPVSQQDIAQVLTFVGEFGDDNRAGITRTLHRISAIRNRKGQVIGLTLRAGRAVVGSIDLLRDLIETGQSLLFLGRPGVGKTTKLREMTRVLADDLHKRVIVVDTSNEIAGDGDIPHPGIGSARRMQVPHPGRQHAVMIEAVENHMPEVIIVDEIGTEAAAARTIAERGVQLIATAHGSTLKNLVVNPTLSDLVGGVQTVILGDDEARRRQTTKTVSERKAPPTFDIVVEMVDRDDVRVHHNTAEAVDTLLRGQPPRSERRKQSVTGQVRSQEVAAESAAVVPSAPAVAGNVPRREGPIRIFAYALSSDLVERVIRSLGVAAQTVREPEQADLILALRARADDPHLHRLRNSSNAALHLIKRNTANELRRLLQNVFYVLGGIDEQEVQEAVRETEAAIRKVNIEGKMVALAPRRPALRKLQQRLIAGHQLVAESAGKEPDRHLIVYPST